MNAIILKAIEELVAKLNCAFKQGQCERVSYETTWSDDADYRGHCYRIGRFMIVISEQE